MCIRDRTKIPLKSLISEGFSYSLSIAAQILHYFILKQFIPYPWAVSYTHLDVYKRQREHLAHGLQHPHALVPDDELYAVQAASAKPLEEDKASWVSFFQWLRGRGLDGVKLIVGDKCMGMLEAVGEVFPDAKYQRCTVHFYRNVFSVVPKSKVKIVAKMLKAIHAQESKKASREKAKAVVAELRAMKLKEAAKKVEDGIEETLTYCDFPSEYWTRIRTNNVIERLNREIRRRTRVVGMFPDGNSALMLVCARLRHVAGTQWGNKKYMNMKHLEAVMDDASIAG